MDAATAAKVLTKDNISTISKNWLVLLVIFSIVGNVFQFQRMTAHYESDLAEKSRELIEKEKIINFWRDANVQSNKMEEMKKDLEKMQNIISNSGAPK